MKLKQFPVSGRCCGPTLTLAVDRTRYFYVQLEDSGGWIKTDGPEEPSFAEFAERLFCPDCGNYFHIPKDLP